MAVAPSSLKPPESAPTTLRESLNTGLLPLIAPLSLALLILIIPLEWGGRSNAGKFLVVGLAVVAALGALLGNRERRRYPAVEIPLLVLLAAGLAATVFSASPWKSLGELELLAAYALAFWSALQLSERDRSLMITTAIGGGALLCLIGLTWWWGSGDPSTLVSSTFYNKNPFAGYLLMIIPLALGRLASATSHRDTLLYSSAVLLFAVTLLLTRSRGAFLVLGVALAVYSLFLWRVKGRGPALRVGLPCLALASAVAGMPGLLALVGAGQLYFPQVFHTDPGRVAYWIASWNMGWDRPISGWGLGLFADIYPQYQASVEHFSRQAHSHYLQAWAEGGALLMGAYLAFATSVLISLARIAGRVEGRSADAALSVLAGSLAFFLHLAIDVDWAFPANPALLMILLGVSCSAASATGSMFFRRGLAVVVLAVFFSVSGLRAGSLGLADQASELLRSGNTDQAAGYLNLARITDPLSPRAACGSAFWHLQLAREGRDSQAKRSNTGRPDPAYHLAAARSASETCVRREIQNPNNHLLAGMVLAESAYGDRAFLDPAEESLRQAIRLDPFNRPRLYLELARFYSRTGQADDAEVLLRKAIAVYPWEKVAAVIANYGGSSKEVLASLRNPKLRIEQPELRAALNLRLEVALLYLELGRSLSAQGKLARGASEMGHALELEPALSEAHRELGALRLAEGRMAEARKHLAAASAQDPTDPQSLLQLARVEIALGMKKPAARTLNRLLLLVPRHKEATLLLGLLQEGSNAARLGAEKTSGPFGHGP